MMLRRLLGFLVIVVLSTLFLSAAIETGRAQAESLGDDAMPRQACVTRGEYEALELGMSLASVRNLFDIEGHPGPNHPDEFSWEWRTCWAPGVKSVRVWFLIPSGLTTRWLIVDA